MSARQRTRKGPPRPGRTQTPDSAQGSKPSQSLVETWRELPDEQKGPNLSELAQQLAQQLPDAEKGKLLATVTQQQVTSSIFSGPIPDPGNLKKYGEISPDLPDRIVSMAEKEQEIRKETQLKLVSNDTERIRGATFLASVAVIGICVTVVIAALKGNTWIALVLGIPVALKGLSLALGRLMPRNDGKKT